MDASADDTVMSFAGARPGECLRVTARGVCLEVDGRRLWATRHDAIRAVLTIRRVSDGWVHDAVQVCATDGDDRHFLVATSMVDDDYDAEFSEAVADAVAESVRRAVGLG